MISGWKAVAVQCKWVKEDCRCISQPDTEYWNSRVLLTWITDFMLKNFQGIFGNIQENGRNAWGLFVPSCCASGFSKWSKFSYIPRIRTRRMCGFSSCSSLLSFMLVRTLRASNFSLPNASHITSDFSNLLCNRSGLEIIDRICANNQHVHYLPNSRNYNQSNNNRQERKVFCLSSAVRANKVLWRQTWVGFLPVVLWTKNKRWRVATDSYHMSECSYWFAHWDRSRFWNIALRLIRYVCWSSVVGELDKLICNCVRIFSWNSHTFFFFA